MLLPKIFFQRLDGADFVSELAQVSINYLEGIVSVAFARKNGADILCNNILNNKKVLFFIGINNGVTSKQALEYLIDQDVHQDIYLVNTGTSQQIFHPKVFCFYDAASKQGVLSLGSSNLTSGGFEKNIEANILLYIDSTNWDLIDTISINLNSIKADCIHLNSKTQLDDLLKDGFLEDETKKSFVEARSSVPQNPSSSKIPKITLKTVIKSQTASPSTSTVTGTTGSQITSTSTVNLVIPPQYKEVWQSKPLTERDLNVPTGSNTNITGSMLWKKGLSNLDPLHDFYWKIFNGLQWQPASNPKKNHLLRANAQFEIYIHGIFKGSFNLTLTHNTLTNTKSYRQGNSMTSVSWGLAKSIIANPAYLGKYMYLYKSSVPTDPFILMIDN
ncbi:phospholipase D family protein [Acinetobacter nosocomialis]|uniref:phospholipase D family protein n=1 Tax=Acinetobacter nosocomialis TaxID=106654 RepID=UPI0012509795|nr:phospholipase D family protein [Acinetobacter nosocomialis]